MTTHIDPLGVGTDRIYIHSGMSDAISSSFLVPNFGQHSEVLRSMILHVGPPTIGLYAGDTLVYAAPLRDDDTAADFYAWCNTLTRPEPLMLMRDAEQFPGASVYALYQITSDRVFEYRKVEFEKTQHQTPPIRMQRILDI